MHSALTLRLLKLKCSTLTENTLRRTCSYSAMGLLLKVMALQKLACLFTVFWARSMTIWDPLAFGWKSSGLIGRGPLMVPHWMGRHLLGLWWHRCDVDGNGPPRESAAGREGQKHTDRVSFTTKQIRSRRLGLITVISVWCFVFESDEKSCITEGLCWLFVEQQSNKLISSNHFGPRRGEKQISKQVKTATWVRDRCYVPWLFTDKTKLVADWKHLVAVMPGAVGSHPNAGSRMQWSYHMWESLMCFILTAMSLKDMQRKAGLGWSLEHEQ